MNRLRLLIIEDDLDQRKLIADSIEEHFGKGTMHFAETLERAMRTPLDTFDLILSDCSLPDATGREVLEQIGWASHTPVILMAGENRAETASDAIRQGAMDYIAKVGDFVYTIPLVIEKNLTIAKIKRENDILRLQLEQAIEKVSEKNKQLEESLHRLQELAATDSLTSLYNRRHFTRASEQLFSEAYRHGNNLACLMLDLDGFKQTNDTHGHLAGDAVLTLAGKVIADNLRRMDVAARYGGDEFVILLPQAGLEEAWIVANRIREQFATSTREQMPNIKVSMSVGIATYQQFYPVTADQLIGAADAALYRAKQAGKDRVEMAVAT